ncbi:hypothetical protein [Streptomyces sp. CO7]
MRARISCPFARAAAMTASSFAACTAARSAPAASKVRALAMRAAVSRAYALADRR